MKNTPTTDPASAIAVYETLLDHAEKENLKIVQRHQGVLVSIGQARAEVARVKAAGLSIEETLHALHGVAAQLDLKGE